MKAVTGREMGRIDKYSIEQIGIPGAVLMENAALKVLKHIELYLEQKPHTSKSVIIVAGKGNNAGDAFAVARHLFVKGIMTRLYCLFGKDSLAGDAKLNFGILERIGIDTRFIEADSELSELCSDIQSAQVVLDGIFGTGFRGETEGHIAKVIEQINKYSRYTISIDIASGIEAASGRTAGMTVRADKTVTFELPKIGQLVYPGAEYTGELAVEGIGMPAEAINSIAVNTTLADRDLIKSFIPKRRPEANKGNCGRVAIVTGSAGMAGSGCLSAGASLKTGSGLVYLAGPSNLINIYQSVVPEAIAVKLKDSGDYINENSINDILSLIKKCNVAAIGPGLSTGSSIYNIIDSISNNSDLPVVLDADALNAAAKNTEVLGKFKNGAVITPHPGEMARLTGLEISYIQQNRIEVTRKYSMLWSVVIVLKGARTIISDKNGEVYINPTGNAGMATAGSGDSLTGIIASFIGQGASPLEAAVAGAYIHGLAGDLAAAAKGEYGMTAMDIVQNIPYAISKIIC